MAQERLSLGDALALARARNPGIHAMTAAAEAARARESGARRPPDPVLQLGAMNVAVPELRADMPNSMVPSLQLMQMLPFPGKLGHAAAVAEQSTAAAAAGADEMWWEVRGDVAMTWWELYALDRQLDVARETLALLADFERIARAMYAAGSGRQTDVLRAGVETARMSADLTRMETMRAAAAMRLNGMLDRPADTPVPATADAPPAGGIPGTDSLRAWAGRDRPLLRGARARVEGSRRAEALARREIWPDLTVGLQYGQRPMEGGAERMASVMVGFSIPVFAASRQLRMREEAAAMARMEEANLAAALAGVDAAIGTLVAEHERAEALTALYRVDVLPQASAAVESALSAYRVGAVDFLMLLDAQMAWNRYAQELHALVAEAGTARARLESAVGRELPRAGPDRAEAP